MISRPVILVPIPIDQRQQRRFIFQFIYLIEQQQRRLLRPLDQLQDKFISGCRSTTDASRIRQTKSTPISASWTVAIMRRFIS